MKRFSLLVPTRERPVFLRKYLDSLNQTTTMPKRIEVLIAYDDDDKETEKILLTDLIKRYNFTIRPCKRERSQFINEDYYNWLGRQADGDYLFVSADDLLFVVPDWDRTFETKIEVFCNNKPDRIIGVGIKDNTPKPKISLPQFPCFPLVTKESLQHFGFILHPFIPTWGADYLFYLLYTGAYRYLAIDDRVYMHHVSIHTRMAPKDATSKSVEKIFNSLKMNPKHNVDLHRDTTIPKQVREFRDFLHNLQNKQT
jgi:glycosyltransferase involved in cell wall biosynthesis